MYHILYEFFHPNRTAALLPSIKIVNDAYTAVVSSNVRLSFNYRSNVI